MIQCPLRTLPYPFRYYISVAGPESSDSDFTWAEFVRHNNEDPLHPDGSTRNFPFLPS